MATRQVLAELGSLYEQQTGHGVTIESVGGVDAARRVQAGEGFDVVMLAVDALDKLVASGHVAAGSRVELMRSPVAVAVRAGAPLPDIGSEDALRRAMLAAQSIGYSTGPSGTHLLRLFEGWGLADTLRHRTVQAPPGVPVATLVASGKVELGFQQLSELMHASGISVIGILPAGAQFITTFAAGICSASARAGEVHALLEFLTSPEAGAVKKRHGMEPA